MEDVDPRILNERLVLGALMSAQPFNIVQRILRPEMFIHPDHQRAFMAIDQLYSEGAGVTPLAVSARMMDLANSTPSLPMLSACVHQLKKEGQVKLKGIAESIRADFVSRSLVEIGKAISESASARNPNAQVISEAMRDIGEMSLLSDPRGTMSLEESARLSVESIAAAYARTEVRGVPYGFDKIQDMMGEPMQYGNLYGLLLDSGGGKTSITLQIIRNAIEVGIPSLFFSFEQDEQQCLQQMSAQRLEIQSRKMRRGDVTEAEFARIKEDHDHLAQLPLKIIRSSHMNGDDVRREMMAFAREYGEGFVAVDHMKSIAPRNAKASFAEQVNDTYGCIRDAAKESRCATMILMQRKASALERQNPTPTRLDGYGGGATYEALDGYIGLYRPVVAYDIKRLQAETTQKQAEWEAKIMAEKEVAQAFVLKNRYGDSNRSRKLRWRAEFTKFEEPKQQEDFSSLF